LLTPLIRIKLHEIDNAKEILEKPEMPNREPHSSVTRDAHGYPDIRTNPDNKFSV